MLFPRSSTLLINQPGFRVMTFQFEIGLGEFFPQAAHNGLLDSDRETGGFHNDRG
ncbi:Uncharacterised protein [Citrobacter koseri]|uniref:Uncharacterized protein n=1 Tax=Citrobacter koseri TaxID=545 RepID=A0A2X2WHS9_CITKO|nr:Uncharacterised protein [Citrobacter koseri]